MAAASDRAPPAAAPVGGERWALFLDFDGTLAELADHPSAVSVPEHLPGTLCRLRVALGGALALVSGRPLSALDAFIGCGPNDGPLPAAGLHGLERRRGDGTVTRAPSNGGELDRLREELQAIGGRYPGVWLEDKGLSLALHFRAVPHAGAALRVFVQDRLRSLSGHELLEGKMVIELKPSAANKGAAIRAFMEESAFRGTIPVFAGDDITDEDGFEAAEVLGGMAIKIGGGPSRARHGLPDVASLHRWLETLECRL